MDTAIVPYDGGIDTSSPLFQGNLPSPSSVTPADPIPDDDDGLVYPLPLYMGEEEVYKHKQFLLTLPSSTSTIGPDGTVHTIKIVYFDKYNSTIVYDKNSI